MSAIITIICIYGFYKINDFSYNHSVEEMLDTVVDVNGSSGIIVYSDSNYALILTNFHVISDLVDIDGSLLSFKKPNITFKYTLHPNNNPEILNLSYASDIVYIDSYKDMALVKINTGIRLRYSRLVTRDIGVGEEIYLAANPNFNYKTVTRGIISNKNRYRNSSQHLWQTDGGIIFGASGGGSFTNNGKLIGLIQSVDAYSPICRKVFDNKRNIIYKSCDRIAIPYIGYFIPPNTIKKFLLSTEFADKFNYLR